MPILSAADTERIRAVSYDAIVSIIGNRRRVLQLGKFDDELARRLGEANCRVTHRPYNKETYETAREAIEDDTADVVVVESEMLGSKDAVAILRQLRAVVLPHVRVVALLPNIDHASVRLAVLKGGFSSKERFFGRRSSEDLFVVAGFRVESVTEVRFAMAETESVTDALESTRIGRSYYERLLTDDGASVVGFLVVASPIVDDAARDATAGELSIEVAEHTSEALEIASIRNRNASLDKEVVALRSKIEELEKVRDGLRAAHHGTSLDRLAELVSEALGLAEAQELEVERLATSQVEAKREAQSSKLQTSELQTELQLISERLELARTDLDRTNELLATATADGIDVTRRFAAERAAMKIERDKLSADLDAERISRRRDEEALRSIAESLEFREREKVAVESELAEMAITLARERALRAREEMEHATQIAARDVDVAASLHNAAELRASLEELERVFHLATEEHRITTARLEAEHASLIGARDVEVAELSRIVTELRASLEDVERVYVRATAERDGSLDRARVALRAAETELREVTERFEQQIATLEKRLDDVAGPSAEALELLTQTRSSYQESLAQYDTLADCFRELEEQFFVQNRTLITNVRQELEALHHLSAGIHASRLWKIKLAVVGLGERVSRMRPRLMFGKTKLDTKRTVRSSS